MVTVQEWMWSKGDGSRSLAGLMGLSRECRQAVLEEAPDLLEPVPREIIRPVNPSIAAWLQPEAVAAVVAATQEHGRSLTLLSAWRSIADQYVLFRWGLQCCGGAQLAARPGCSSHELGLALTTSEPESWVQPLQRWGWQWLGPCDPQRFCFPGQSPQHTNDGQRLIASFQTLWNRYHPQALLRVDGAFGPLTEAALLQSPCQGFAHQEQRWFGRVLYFEPSCWLVGEDVSGLQQQLLRQGLLRKEDHENGFGPKTEQAVCRYQIRFGLTVDGIVGPCTARAMHSLSTETT